VKRPQRSDVIDNRLMQPNDLIALAFVVGSPCDRHTGFEVHVIPFQGENFTDPPSCHLQRH